MTKEKILVFIPCYNCENQITRVLSQLNDEILQFIDEVIIVNNLSKDQTVLKAQDYLQSNKTIPCKIINNNSNFNLGGSHKVAFNYAEENDFDYVIVLHGDDQADIRDFLPLLKSGDYRNYDCVLGSRFVKGSKLIGYSKKRILGNKLFNMVFSISCGRKIRDMGSGLNLYKTSALSTKYYVNLSDALYFNAEMLIFSSYYKHKWLFYPITWREDDQVSNAKLFSLGISLLKMAAKYFFIRKRYIEGFNKPNVYFGIIIYDNQLE